MIKHTYFIPFYFLLLSFLICPMEQNPKIVNEPLTLALLDIKHPKFHNILAVGYTDGCYLTDSCTHAIIKKLHSEQTINITSHPQKKIIATHAYKDPRTYPLRVYDVSNIEEPKIIWSIIPKPQWFSVAFSNIDDTIFMYQNGKITDNKGNSYLAPCKNSYGSSKISCHPTKKEVIYRSDRNCFSVIKCNPDDPSDYSIDNDYPPMFDAKYEMKIHGISHNPQGTLAAILITGADFCGIYNFQNKTILDYLPCSDMAWHPNGFVIAMLTRNRLTYYNNNTKKTIAHKTTHKGIDSCAGIQRHTIDFSPDGTKLAAIVEDHYRIFDVPFETILDNIYHKGTREQLFTLFCLLKTQELPYDIQLLLMNSLLDLQEYSEIS